MGTFGKDVMSFALKVAKSNEQIVRGTTIQLFSQIVKLSPVGIGRFRANWFVTGVQPSVKVTENTDFDAGAVAAKIGSIKDWTTFHLTNNLPYACELEFGHSQQAPEGMVRITIRKFNAVIEAQARKVK